MNEFKTISMKFTSRASVKIRDNFYTFEATIEKQCPENFTDNEYDEAKQKLWDECNLEIDRQIIEIREYLQNKK